MKTIFIKSNEKKKILEQLKEQYGISDLPYLLIESGKEKIRAFSGSLSKEEITELGNITNIETIGSYLLKKERSIRLSLDATQILSKQIKKGIITISEEEYELWIRGNNLPTSKPKGTYIVKFNEDYIGSGISNGQVLLNHIPKERRLKIPIKNE